MLLCVNMLCVSGINLLNADRMTDPAGQINCEIGGLTCG
jgi:hypothetical protein